MVICHSRQIYFLKFTVVFSNSGSMVMLRSFADINNVLCEFWIDLNLNVQICMCEMHVCEKLGNNAFKNKL